MARAAAPQPAAAQLAPPVASAVDPAASEGVAEAGPDAPRPQPDDFMDDGVGAEEPGEFISGLGATPAAREAELLAQRERQRDVVFASLAGEAKKEGSCCPGLAGPQRARGGLGSRVAPVAPGLKPPAKQRGRRQLCSLRL